MATLIFGNPLIFQEGTGLSITPGGTELFGKQARTVTFSIGQAVATTSNVEFNVVTGSSVVTDNGTLILKGNTISIHQKEYATVALRIAVARRVLGTSLKITTGALIACVILSGRVLSPLVQTGQLLTRLNGAITAFKNVNELMKEESRDETLQDVKGVIIDSGSVKLKNLEYSINESKILENINLSIKDGEKFAVVGPLGCGKSTLSRSINGLIPHVYPGSYTGSVEVNGVDVSSTSMNVLSTQVGYLFQNPENQIFMFSVERDIAFGLENLGLSRKEIREKVDWAMDVTGITNLAKMAPHELSDGQKQRVALAGILSMDPQLLLLDEPTSLLDPKTAFEIIQTVNDLRTKLNMAVIIVEHRLDIITTLAKKAIVLEKGKIISQGTIKKVLNDEKVMISGVGLPCSVNIRNSLINEGINAFLFASHKALAETQS